LYAQSFHLKPFFNDPLKLNIIELAYKIIRESLGLIRFLFVGTLQCPCLSPHRKFDKDNWHSVGPQLDQVFQSFLVSGVTGTGPPKRCPNCHWCIEVSLILSDFFSVQKSPEVISNQDANFGWN
jgi:hypothetical protein